MQNSRTIQGIQKNNFLTLRERLHRSSFIECADTSTIEALIFMLKYSFGVDSECKTSTFPFYGGPTAFTCTYQNTCRAHHFGKLEYQPSALQYPSIYPKV